MRSKIISEWVYDPTKNIFGDKNGHAARYTIICQNASECDLYNKEKTCLLSGALSSCKFGQKNKINGPTKRSRSFRGWLEDQRRSIPEDAKSLKSLRAYDRIFLTNGHYYLPYTGMAKEMFLSECPLETKFVEESRLDSALLSTICGAAPRGMWDRLTDYQTKTIPKFIADLSRFYPAVFALLPEDQKSRLKTVSYIGRTADITTVAPGEYVIGSNKWKWDGNKLTGGNMLFQPVKGNITITIHPETGEPVKITDNAQVTDETVFLD